MLVLSALLRVHEMQVTMCCLELGTDRWRHEHLVTRQHGVASSTRECARDCWHFGRGRWALGCTGRLHRIGSAFACRARVGAQKCHKHDDAVQQTQHQCARLFPRFSAVLINTPDSGSAAAASASTAASMAAIPMLQSSILVLLRFSIWLSAVLFRRGVCRRSSGLHLHAPSKLGRGADLSSRVQPLFTM